MSITLKNQSQLQTYIRQQTLRIEKAIIYALEYMVEDLTNHAKTSAGYEDQTSNLKSSIGGVVLYNGAPVNYTGFVGVDLGVEEGSSYIDTLIKEYSNYSGFVVILVAGMEYATYVEDYHGLNVLKSSELKMLSALPAMIEKIKAKYENAK